MVEWLDAEELKSCVITVAPSGRQSAANYCVHRLGMKTETGVGSNELTFARLHGQWAMAVRARSMVQDGSREVWLERRWWGRIAMPVGEGMSPSQRRRRRRRRWEAVGEEECGVMMQTAKSFHCRRWREEKEEEQARKERSEAR
jgi:hypothetical protein